MAPDSDPNAVVDQELRVRGVDGLRVADTSMFPAMPSRGPNATAMMVGERLADLLA
jgi:choline dehydrogenase-like flavoprotein